MIPISADQILDYKDEESGLIFHFRPQVGRVEVLINKYYSFFHNRNKPFLKEAEKQLANVCYEKEEERQKAVSLLASKMAGDDFSDTEQYLAIIDDVIDAALCGWTGEGFPVFPKDNKPSRMFKMLDKTKILTEYIQLNELTGDDKKN
jgi:hypothetical protein